jgi:hypothetical protein
MPINLLGRQILAACRVLDRSCGIRGMETLLKGMSQTRSVGVLRAIPWEGK